MTTWTNDPPPAPGFFWAKARFLGPEGKAEPVRVEISPHFGVSWEEFAKEQAARSEEQRVPVEWVFQVYVFGTDVPYAIGDIDAWGPAIPQPG
jgi:hypothetical protein